MNLLENKSRAFIRRQGCFREVDSRDAAVSFFKSPNCPAPGTSELVRQVIQFGTLKILARFLVLPMRIRGVIIFHKMEFVFRRSFTLVSLEVALSVRQCSGWPQAQRV